MKIWTRFAFVLLFVPVVASAQFRDLDAAMGNLERGFASADVDAIVSGIGADEQVMLQFPGLADKSGFFGRDQAAYLLDGLFNRVKPSGFERVSVRGQRAEGQHHIKARWTINEGTRDLYITLQQKGDRYSVVSIRSGG
ncbi:MAG TPA: hypothetical protein VND45_14335 [Thermoanaerobaculia bacterium]|nr:hypothetical protein [Thermoanaerobaculia bacterium]